MSWHAQSWEERYSELEQTMKRLESKLSRHKKALDVAEKGLDSLVGFGCACASGYQCSYCLTYEATIAEIKRLIAGETGGEGE